ncbi:MAG: TetR family transcriptional regulator [Thermoleophilia bacterium]
MTPAVRTGPVTAEIVIDAALAIIDDEGLATLTMRRLAKDLGVEPMTVYRQLPNKEAILAGVAEKLWREMPGARPESATDATDGGVDSSATLAAEGEPEWRAQVHAMWLALHALMQAHPNAIPIIAKGSTYSRSASGGTAAMAAVLRDAGLSPAQAGELMQIVAACVVGFGFATLWGQQIAHGERPNAPAGEALAPISTDDDLERYLTTMGRWEPANFTRALDLVLDAYTPNGAPV